MILWRKSSQKHHMIYLAHSKKQSALELCYDEIRYDFLLSLSPTNLEICIEIPILFFRVLFTKVLFSQTIIQVVWMKRTQCKEVFHFVKLNFQHEEMNNASRKSVEAYKFKWNKIVKKERLRFVKFVNHWIFQSN